MAQGTTRGVPIDTDPLLTADSDLLVPSQKAIKAYVDNNTGTVTSVAALTLGTTGTDLSSTVANNTTTPVITLNVPDASATARGVVTTGTQTLAGAKTFSTAPILSSLTASQILATDASKNIQSLTTATYPSLTELSYVKGVTSSLQTQINGKQATLTNPVTGTGTNNEIAYFNTTGSTIGSLTTGTYPSLTELSYVKGVTSALQTQLAAKQDLSLSAYSFRANNTASTANATDTTYRDPGEQTYTGTASWTGTTAPSGTTNHSYRWSQVGKLVTLRINLSYTVAGNALTLVSMTLPTDCPTPASPSGVTAANEIICYGAGALATAKTVVTFATIGATIAGLRRNNANTGYDVVVTRPSTAWQYAYATIQYFTA